MNKTILLNKRPKGKPRSDDFKFVEEEMPHIGPEEVLLKTSYVSVDPYLRSKMNDAKSYTAPFELHKPMYSGVIAQVVESKHSGFKEGENVSGMLDWKEYQASNGKGLYKVDAENKSNNV